MKKFENFFYLAEGGNLSIDNKYFADDINLDYISADQAKKFIEDLENLLREINKIYLQEYGTPLWEQLEVLLRTNKIYSGSSRIFVEFVKEGKFDIFAQYKKLVGDIDLQFCEEFSKQFEQLFLNKDSKLSNINAPTEIGQFIFFGEGGTGVIQKNCLFGYKFGIDMDTGEENDEKITNIQIDFEPVSFERGIPTKFSQFSHSASFEDIQDGIKGVFHKFLIQSILDVSNEILVDTSLYTLKSGKETTRKNIKKTLYSFSVDKGFRDRYSPAASAPNSDIVLKNNKGALVYFDIKPTEKEALKKDDYIVPVKKGSDLFRDLEGITLANPSSLPTEDKKGNSIRYVFINPDSLKYSEDLDVLFTLMFGEEPDENDRKNFHSFTGLLNILKKYQGRSSASNIENKIYSNFLEKLYSPSAQLLYKRDSRNPKGQIHDRDFSTKQAAVNKFQDLFTNVTSDFSKERFDNLIDQYYNIK